MTTRFSTTRPGEMIGDARGRFDAEENMTDEKTKEFIRRLPRSLVDWRRRVGRRQTAGG